ncbi:signal peptidase I [Algicella marina]|uniref:Signal peptidase I n=1 Tax=Algicella marina TaxID=2683284 RepID=A0A6P1T2X9_9RHOB|nr:signal peptidase I [Algicella marina]QHQ37078.1 signal peptidase I [Algicella marina]
MASKTKSSGGGLGELIKTIVYALLLAGLIRTIIFQPFWIPTGSMKPTLLIGDFLFVNKFAYGYSAYSCPGYRDFNLCAFAEGSDKRLLESMPERGDVVVFRHPVSGQDYIKRLIGLPGDTIEVRNGQVILNGETVSQELAAPFVEIKELQGPARSLPQCTENVGLGGRCEKEQFVETLPNGVAHATLSFGTTTGDNSGPFTVPDRQFFFMGDNRDNSLDSRFARPRGVGFVPMENLIGRADRVIFSSAGKSILFFWTWRSDRFFKAIE